MNFNLYFLFVLNFPVHQPPKLLQQQLEPLHGLKFISFVATTARNGIGAWGLGVMRMENVPSLKD